MRRFVLLAAIFTASGTACSRARQNDCVRIDKVVIEQGFEGLRRMRFEDPHVAEAVRKTFADSGWTNYQPLSYGESLPNDRVARLCKR